MSKPIASLSLDLDNKWAYLRTHGADDWEQSTSYLPTAVPRVLDFLSRHELRATVFVVGRDLACALSQELVSDIAATGHEIGNHTYNHYPWLDQMEAAEMADEIDRGADAIERATGTRPVGFRAPGFSASPAVLEHLVRSGYTYDASAFPTIIGPLAAMYARLLPKRSSKTAAPGDRRQKFATLGDGFRNLRPHVQPTTAGSIVELPVTTMPMLRVPIHATYFMYLAQRSKLAARSYIRTAVRLCRWRNVGPSMLLHALDFLGESEEPELAFFPGMRLSLESKLELLSYMVKLLTKHYRVTTVAEHARVVDDIRTQGASQRETAMSSERDAAVVG